jgi:hypothetical protein
MPHGDGWRNVNLSDENIARLFDELFKWGPWGVFVLVFMIWGLPHVPPIISAIGAIFNERHKTNLSHRRSMMKIENQHGKDPSGKDARK